MNDKRRDDMLHTQGQEAPCAGSREQGGRLKQSLYSAEVRAPWKGEASYPCSGSLHAEEKGLLPQLRAPFPSASSVMHFLRWLLHANTADIMGRTVSSSAYFFVLFYIPISRIPI